MVQDSITIGIAKVSTINRSPYNITNNYNYITSPSLHKHTYIEYYIITYIRYCSDVMLHAHACIFYCALG